MKRTLILCITLLLMLMLAVPVMAQDETLTPTEEPAATTEATAIGTEEVVKTAEPTADATADVVTATPQPTPIVIIITQPVDPPPPAPTDSNASAVIVIVISLLTLVLGGGTLMSIIAGFRKDAAGVAATEALGKSVPQDVALELVRLLKGAVSGAEIAIEALDQIPAASKPPAIALYTIDELTNELERRGYKVSAV